MLGISPGSGQGKTNRQVLVPTDHPVAMIVHLLICHYSLRNERHRFNRHNWEGIRPPEFRPLSCGNVFVQGLRKPDYNVFAREMGIGHNPVFKPPPDCQLIIDAHHTPGSGSRSTMEPRDLNDGGSISPFYFGCRIIEGLNPHFLGVEFVKLELGRSVLGEYSHQCKDKKYGGNCLHRLVASKRYRLTGYTSLMI
jgi:hypothetical protein